MSIFDLCIADNNGLREDPVAKTVSYFVTKPAVLVTERLISEMKEYACKNEGKNVRICLHQDPSALFHEMIILEVKESYYPPHKHLQKEESRHIMEGENAIFVFDEDGNIEDSAILGLNGNLIYRVASNCYHYGIPLTNYVIYHEAKRGPFTGEGDSIFAPWAPGRNDVEGAKKYIDGLLSKLSRSGA